MRYFRLLAASCAALALFVFVACDNSGTGPGTTVTVPAAVDSLQATSINQTTVRLRWRASATAAVTGYRVTIVNTASGATIGTTNTTSTLFDVTGLTAGTVYAFRIQSRTADTVSTAREIRWSPAVRVTTMQGGAIRIYETASGFGSGLRIQGGTALNLTVARGNEWDLGINTRSDTMRIGSPGRLGYTGITMPRTTRIGNAAYTNIDSLSQVFDTEIQMGPADTFDVPRTVTRGFVFAFQTQEGNFAKVLVKSASGVILQGASPNRYIEVEISYQPVANVPYAIVPTMISNNGKSFDGGVSFSR
ncbi:MAG: fibronectin type III domain-containing protein [Candidatus Kapabacteria bacterium]|jgi:hypothetical protein|nr:fibronectin type III domain-containing protein [Candidatus Kapabacteria bacterium]